LECREGEIAEWTPFPAVECQKKGAFGEEVLACDFFPESIAHVEWRKSVSHFDGGREVEGRDVVLRHFSDDGRYFRGAVGVEVIVLRLEFGCETHFCL